MMKRNFLIIIFVLLACLVVLRSAHFQKHVKIGGKTIEVEVADTPESRERGLSGREPLPEGHGMLFVFPEPGRYGFWMKDMKFSLDMIWLDQSGKIVYIKEDATPESYPDIFTPEADAKYVLEVNAGFSTENNLKVGDKVELNY